jgi:putative ABC transport system permease protein
MLDPRWQKVARDLWAHKSRTVLVVLSIAVGVVSFAGLLIARAAVTSNLDDDYGSANAYDIAIDLPGFDDTLVRWAAGQPGVTGAQGVTAYSGEMTFAGTTHNVTLLAYDDYNDIQINKIEPEQGAWPPQRGQILIERSFINKLGVHDGDAVSIKLNTDQRYELTYAGSAHDVTIMGGVISTRIQAYVARRAFNQLDVPVDFNRLYVTVALPQADVNKVADDLRESLRERGMIAGAITVNQNHEYWAAAQINGIALILTIVGSLALVFSGFLVVNIINGLLLQQKRVIGVMKIVGGRRPQIIAIYMATVACFGLLALVLAVPASLLVGYSLAAYVGPQTLNFDLLHFNLPPSILALEIAVALLAPMTFALFPILNATRLSAAQAISDYVARRKASLLDIALARLERLPRQTLMALRNTFRQTSRLVLTLLTLVLAGALFMAISNVSVAVPYDVRKSLGMSAFDVQASLARPVDSAAVEQRAAAVPNVVDAEGWVATSAARLRPGGVLGGNMPFYGVPLDSHFAAPNLARGRWLAPMAQGGGSGTAREIVVSTSLVNTKEKDVNVGDVITLRRNSDPTTDEQWRVVGVINTQIPVAYAELPAVVEFAGLRTGLVNVLNVRATDSGMATQRQVADDLTRVFNKEWNVRVVSTTTRTEAVNNVLDGFNIITTILYAVALLIALVGGMGLAGTMSLSVMERTREIGVMRSVGARTKTLRSMFITEGLLIGLLSFVIALPLSLPATVAFDNLLAGALRFSPFTFVVSPTGSPIWLALVAVISIVSSLMPAQRATQISIREALAYE